MTETEYRQLNCYLVNWFQDLDLVDTGAGQP